MIPAEKLPDGVDVQKFDGGPQGHAVVLKPGFFVAIFPGEAHMVGGQVIPGETDHVSKWVVKVPVQG